MSTDPFEAGSSESKLDSKLHSVSSTIGVRLELMVREAVGLSQNLCPARRAAGSIGRMKDPRAYIRELPLAALYETRFPGHFITNPGWVCSLEGGLHEETCCDCASETWLGFIPQD